MASSSLRFLEVESVLSPSAFIFLLSSFAREFFLQFICSSKILKWVLEFEISYGFFLSLLFSGFWVLPFYCPTEPTKMTQKFCLKKQESIIKWWRLVAASFSFVYKYYQLVVLLVINFVHISSLQEGHQSSLINNLMRSWEQNMSNPQDFLTII